MLIDKLHQTYVYQSEPLCKLRGFPTIHISAVKLSAISK